MSYKKRGRPLLGPAPRRRVTVTLSAKNLKWLHQKARQAKEPLSQVLDQLVTGQRITASEIVPRIPIPTEKIRRLCQKYRVRRLSLFGSVLTERFAPGSDVDVLIEFSQGQTPGLLDLARLEVELQETLGVEKIDLKTINEISPYFLENVVRESQVLYAA